MPEVELLPQKPKGKPGRPKKVKVPNVFDPTKHQAIKEVVKAEDKTKEFGGWSGEFVRVKLFTETNNPKGGLYQFNLGDRPRYFVAPNTECIMPIEIFNNLQDTTTEVIDCDMDNARAGQRVEYGTRINVRIPYQYMGTATYAEYRAIIAREFEKPPYKPLR